MTEPYNQISLSSPTTMAGAVPSMSPGTVSPWSVFWVVSLAVFLVSMDGTMLFAAFAFRSVFGSGSGGAIASTKFNTGHLMGTAGGVNSSLLFRRWQP